MRAMVWWMGVRARGQRWLDRTVNPKPADEWPIGAYTIEVKQSKDDGKTFWLSEQPIIHLVPSSLTSARVLVGTGWVDVPLTRGRDGWSGASTEGGVISHVRVFPRPYDHAREAWFPDPVAAAARADAAALSWVLADLRSRQ